MSTNIEEAETDRGSSARKYTPAPRDDPGIRIFRESIAHPRDRRGGKVARGYSRISTFSETSGLFFSRYTHDLVRLAARACEEVMYPEVIAYPPAVSVSNC